MGVRLDHGDEELADNHEINVTPFIDVMLVLLIIFMVAAPLSTVDVAVDLPSSNAQPQPRPEKPLFLTVKEDLTLALGDTPMDRGMLQMALDVQTNNNREERVFVRADKVVPYGDVMEVMNLLRSAGYLKIGLVGLEGAPAQGTSPAAPAAPPSAAASGAAQ
ncbi:MULTISPECIES: TonB system transport protein ExbD [unclassified Chelatococcus]|uniref:TonB system transport protein ExbD n=1 Tax=unclassified Chelatococcus TaxID=2638111 RepID=UPI001BCD3281|nr:MULTISPECIES: TonB system transport protein ExbD [unclassified Chelatococcus]CAH1657332.1 Ton complex subunit ExbD [Hyphomicrobiales bacterium]MBS7740665.1 TonB system transport protein ExbD [Chelatococcus sp. HY11]MBX3544551.1 TonB system transport protein ExbD [Chelatococcus sp.]MCO5079850.1 TonB system transport protein ExbD [Chelatococcus sp.]CAH1684462.1 Ton complex subunit ExbD [Hyphomicrobiales bacterium]